MRNFMYTLQGSAMIFIFIRFVRDSMDHCIKVRSTIASTYVRYVRET